MRCANCHRRLTAATVTIGRLVLGPTCARKAGLIVAKRRTRAMVPAVLQDGQLPLWEAV